MKAFQAVHVDHPITKSLYLLKSEMFPKLQNLSGGINSNACIKAKSQPMLKKSTRSSIH